MNQLFIMKLFPILIFQIQFVLNFSAIMIIVAIVNYWLLIPTAVMSILFYLIRNIYVSSGRSLKRIEALSMYIPILHIELFMIHSFEF